MDNQMEFFGRVYADTMRNPAISTTAKALYSDLSLYCGAGNQCFPSVDTILGDLGITESTFRKHMEVLTAAGIVKVERVKDARGRFAHNLYTLNIPSLKDCAMENLHDGKNKKSSDGKSKKPPMANQGSNDKYKSDNGKKAAKPRFHNYEERPDNDYAEIQRQLLLKSYREKSEAVK